MPTYMFRLCIDCILYIYYVLSSWLWFLVNTYILSMGFVPNLVFQVFQWCTYMYKLNTVRTFLDIACSASQLVLAIALERQANFNIEHFRMITGSDAGTSRHEIYSAGWFVCCIRLTWSLLWRWGVNGSGASWELVLPLDLASWLWFHVFEILYGRNVAQSLRKRKYYHSNMLQVGMNAKGKIASMQVLLKITTKIKCFKLLLKLDDPLIIVEVCISGATDSFPLFLLHSTVECIVVEQAFEDRSTLSIQLCF